MREVSIAIMAMSFFGVVAVSIRSITGLWMKRMEMQRHSLPITALGQQMERIESAVEVIALEVERISEAQRFSARLLAERDPSRLPVAARAPESRITTPH